ncbi:Cadherin domain protein [Rubripirellula lacrimiformis]|uniref:Cadherin domain protein n=1 Tax=Rubripirellula lacrimiformis TaxID=1930273 RepID=A0A517NH42_9BACT|nr:dockerin type I domain-containing protein [Rubripirellula lacrimiformis]QDT06461.1 Cadherin domain protein [Rubripirellula lacrimiformis]
MVKRQPRSSMRRIQVRRRLTLEHLSDRRVLAAITGAVFDDLNQSLYRDTGEPDAASRLIYLDLNANAQLDVGERLSLAGSDGSFNFDNLPDGTYSVRLFNATSTQQQTFPVEAVTPMDAIEITDGIRLIAGDASSSVLTTDSIVFAAPSSGTSTNLTVGDELTAMQSLPDGRLLVVGTDSSTDNAWIVDPTTSAITPVELSTIATAWATVSLDSDGHGVLLESVDPISGPAQIPVRSIDASNLGTGINVTVTTTMVPSDTQVLSSATGVRSVFGSTTNDGLSLSLWSNSTASLIGSPIDVAGTSELLSFDDASGLLVLRTTDGGVSVRDVNADFAPLYSLADQAGPVVIDGKRDLLITYSPADSAVQVIHLQDAEVIANLAVDLSAIGQVSSLAIGETPDSLILLGAAGVHEVRLTRPAAHTVTIVGGANPDAVEFGIFQTGGNAAPRYDELPLIETNEDEPLTLAAPAATLGSADADDDNYVLVQTGSAQHGAASITIRGAVAYTPDQDFHGTDTVTVVLHDGQTASAATALNITVQAVPDPPTDIDVDIPTVPENIPTGVPIGTIGVTDVDGGGGHTIGIDDIRFEEDGGQIIFVGGDLDFESEPTISIGISATDPDTNETIEKSVSIQIGDANDPITGITPKTAFVFENAPGDIVTELKVQDQDAEQVHTFTVDDQRFIVEGFDLRLADGVSVDYETEPTIVVHVTATEVGGPNSYTEEITITVRDLPEQGSALTLTDDTIMELTLGDEVGEIKIDGGTPAARFTLTVDDSRFEVSGSTLKLKDDEFVELAVQSEIQVTVTADDSMNEFASIEQPFIIKIVGNESPLHNLDDPYDVDHGGDVTAADALAIINYLNIYGPGPVGSGGMGYCYDVNADGFVTALDALLVLNQLNQTSSGTVGGEGDQPGEGEQPNVPNPIPRLDRQSIADDDSQQQDPVAQELTAPSSMSLRDDMFVQWQSQSSGTAGLQGEDHQEDQPSPSEVDATLRLLADDQA